MNHIIFLDIINRIEIFKNTISANWDYLLPSPHVLLLKGLSYGQDDLSNFPSFKQALIDTGTIHVAVVSGYNISLVVTYAKKVFGNNKDKPRTLLYIFSSFMYVMFVGFEPPVIRAWIMSSISLLAKGEGRALKGVTTLFIACFIMYLRDTNVLTSLSFILSSLATLGLIVLSDPISSIVNKLYPKILYLFKEDFIASMSATLLVWPVISYNFERVSWLSPFINMFILWTIPVATLAGMCLIGATWADNISNSNISGILALLIYPYLDIFIRFIELVSTLKWITIDYKIGIYELIIYYTLITGVLLYKYRVQKI